MGLTIQCIWIYSSVMLRGVDVYFFHDIYVCNEKKPTVDSNYFISGSYLYIYLNGTRQLNLSNTKLIWLSYYPEGHLPGLVITLEMEKHILWKLEKNSMSLTLKVEIRKSDLEKIIIKIFISISCLDSLYDGPWFNLQTFTN